MNYKDLFEYTIGDTVYLKTDKDQNKRIVTAICIRHGNYVVYELSQGSFIPTWHTAMEITSDIDVLIKTDS